MIGTPGIRRLKDEHRRALDALADREYRDPAEQAAYLIVDGLKRAGILTDQTNESTGSPATQRPV
jgi:hypothetical protein